MLNPTRTKFFFAVILWLAAATAGAQQNYAVPPAYDYGRITLEGEIRFRNE